MLRKISLAIALLLAAVLLLAATRPDSFAVQRSTSIRAPADKVYALIHDMHRFNTWNPYLQKDPNVKGSYSGPAAGHGARYVFEGNRDVGKGSLEITEAQAPARVAMRLRMLEPFAGENDVAFTLVPRGDSTEVTWAMHGASPYLARLAGLFFDMDHMIGRDFETGLQSLKSKAENG
ncbi:SRPBCC family protein [Pseudorhodoferax sp. Leaf267]|uniref:SRPBCC family protein n=1 Tax=Pseudorhodoferax sp. Leaf267 TaxID=1736316 RepID=UPI0006FF24BF|nr:SRPBCC family protein [Pseudorhodoferax sp. Leaf267]KQP13825.1 polyketide cyclase [Pseudorhodoferax sp. Leaf267]